MRVHINPEALSTECVRGTLTREAERPNPISMSLDADWAAHGQSAEYGSIGAVQPASDIGCCAGCGAGNSFRKQLKLKAIAGNAGNAGNI